MRYLDVDEYGSQAPRNPVLESEQNAEAKRREEDAGYPWSKLFPAVFLE